MAKKYLTPAMQVTEAQVTSIIAVSIQDGTADPDKPILTKENDDWDVWGDEE